MRSLLLSGGIDSIAIAYWLRPDLAITIDYGQQCAEAEIAASANVCTLLKIRHEIIKVDCSSLGAGDLVGRQSLEIAPVSEWWPFRNQLLVTLACMKAVKFGILELLVGSVRTDKTHIDGTIEFYQSINSLVSIQEGNINVVAPGINMDSIELVREASVPINILGWAHSCHKANRPCGYCNGCKKHIYIMQQFGFL